MSYFNENSMSVDFGERQNHKRIYFEPRQPEVKDETPPDAHKGWEFYKDHHICWSCHKQGHESEMMRNSLHYWVHTECEEKVNINAKKICDEISSD